MSVLDIVLIILGVIFVVISYYITEKVPVGKNEEDASVTEVWGEKEEGTIKERVKNIVSDKSEEMIETVEDRLCHLSNDKIMEFKDYSDQVMDSIKQEHKQAVFLYNMLNEKEESTKKLLNEIDIKYAALSDRLNKICEKLNIKKNGKVEKAERIEKKSANSNTIQEVGLEKKQEVTESDINDKEEKAGPDRNDKILKLWKQGKNVLEISRLLGIGQGEVKLVIDLFKGV